jgi:predicted RND superfamily exporter protein
MTQVTALHLAQLFSLTTFFMAAMFYFVPWTRLQDRAVALQPLIWVQVFRFIALQSFSAQASGSMLVLDDMRDQIVFGDIIAATLAIVTIVALHYRMRVAAWLAWLVVAATVFDFGNNIASAAREHVDELSSGTTWMIQTFYLPLIVLAVVFTVWQLVARRHEKISAGFRGPVHAA